MNKFFLCVAIAQFMDFAFGNHRNFGVKTVKNANEKFEKMPVMSMGLRSGVDGEARLVHCILCTLPICIRMVRVVRMLGMVRMKIGVAWHAT